MVRGALLVLAGFLLGSTSCVWIEDDDARPPYAYDLWVSFDDPSTIRTENPASLSGEVECYGCPPDVSAIGYCAELACPSSTGIGVSWVNHTARLSGSASASIRSRCACLSAQCWTYCEQAWTALVPLALGVNDVEIRAEHPDGAYGSASASIWRLQPAP